MRLTKKFTKEEMTNFISQSYSIADVCRLCGWKPIGGNYGVIKRYIKEYELDTSHFTGYRTNIGNRLNLHKEKKAKEYLKKNSYIKLTTLRDKLVREGIKEYKCEKCGISEWNGEQISLQIHHINGDNTDNRIENIMFLCPNCHSQTDSFCGKKNIKNEKKYYCRNCGKTISNTRTGFCDDCYKLLINGELIGQNFSLDKKEINTIKCTKCGELITKFSKSGLCPKCSKNELRVVERPSKEELTKLLFDGNFTSVSKIFNVSDNTIRKWCKTYGMSPHSKDYIK